MEKLDNIIESGLTELFGKEVKTDWKAKLSMVFEELRAEYVSNKDYILWDLDFEHTFCMKTGLTRSTFKELNNLSLKHLGESCL